MTDHAKQAQQILFQSSLADVVRKIRNSKSDERETIAQCLVDVRSEITSQVQSVKVTAVVKLTYFTMLGYGADYAAFHVIEVMADASFSNKRAGYIAAALTFNAHTDVLPLCTALLKRDLASTNAYEAGLALYFLSAVCTPDLARDLVSDVVQLLGSQKAYVRKKAVLCLYKLFLEFPEALRPTYPRLREKIEDGTDRADSDPMVRCAVVSVLCEMARRNPANFISLAVPFFSLLSTVHNNWTLIKVIKVFGYFAPIEPRLGKKLVEPLSALLSGSTAKSVQYECIFAVANGMSRVSSLTKLVVEKMKLFVDDADQNLKYLGLEAMSHILVESPKYVADQRDAVLRCLEDNDTIIRRRALHILQGMATRKNLVATVNAMYDRVQSTPADDDWSNAVIEAIVNVSRAEDYALVQDFEWYLGILVDLSVIPLASFQHGALLEEEFVTVLARVRAVRQYGVESLTPLITHPQLTSCDFNRSTQWRVVRAACFVCGEYPLWISDTAETVAQLLSDRMSHLPSEVQVIAVAAVGKIFAATVAPVDRLRNLRDGEDELARRPTSAIDVDALRARLIPPSDGSGGGRRKGLLAFCHSVYPDVQEQAQWVRYFIHHDPCGGAAFYAEEMLAVAAGAQAAVVAPDDVVMAEPFCADIPSLVPASESDNDEAAEDAAAASIAPRATSETSARTRRSEVGVYYIDDTADDDLPVAESLDSLPANMVHRRAHKVHTISRDVSKPQTYVAPTAKKPSAAPEDEATRKLRGIDVSKALGPDDALPRAQPYGAKAPSAVDSDVTMHEPVIFCEDKRLRWVAQVGEMKVKKGLGWILSLAISITNFSPTLSLHDVTMTLRSEGAVWAPTAEGAEPTSTATVSDRLRPTASATRELSLLLPTLPDDLAAPLALRLAFTKEKKPATVDAAWPLRAAFFLAPPTAWTAWTAGSFFSTALPTLERAAEAAVAAVPWGNGGGGTPAPPSLAAPPPSVVASGNLSLQLPRLRSALRLTPVETLRDCAVWAGTVVTRKSQAATSTIAVLLAERVVEGEGRLVIAVRGGPAPLAKCLLGEVRQLLTAS